MEKNEKESQTQSKIVQQRPPDATQDPLNDNKLNWGAKDKNRELKKL